MLIIMIMMMLIMIIHDNVKRTKTNYVSCNPTCVAQAGYPRNLQGYHKCLSEGLDSPLQEHHFAEMRYN